MPIYAIETHVKSVYVFTVMFDYEQDDTSPKMIGVWIKCDNCKDIFTFQYD